MNRHYTNPRQLSPILGTNMKVAAVHEWLDTYAGSERVLEEILSMYPQADVFALVDFLPQAQRQFLRGRRVTTSFIQHLPGARKFFRWYLPLMPFAIEQFDLSDYDLIISSSHAVAKGVISRPHQPHISYVHSPMRYAWDLQRNYLTAGKWRSLPPRMLMHYLRLWDARTANGVDHFIANSAFIAQRILKAYRRTAEVIYPPVDVEKFAVVTNKEDFYITLSRLVPYKRVGMVVDAFARMPQRHLLVVGDGPELSTLKSRASANVSFTGRVSNEAKLRYLQNAKAFVFAGEEDFGISLVESQACGTPVIAFGRGGAAEIVVHGETGLLFDEQSPQALIAAVDSFERMQPLEPKQIGISAQRFGVARFRREFRALIDRAMGPICGVPRAQSESSKPRPMPHSIAATSPQV
jgi:glycosyltransferase involved in cell wall biosynthesis